MSRSRPRRWEGVEQSIGFDLEEFFDTRQAGQATTAQAAEADAGRDHPSDGDPCRAGDDDLTPMGRRADACCGVDGQTDVPNIREGGAAAMDPHTSPDLEVVGPDPRAERALDVRGRLDGSLGAFEGCEKLVGARIDLAAARFGHRSAEDAPHVVPHVAIPVAHAMEQGGGALDISHQEGDKSGGERRRTDTVFLRSQLAGEEPDGYNAVLLRGIEQPLAGTLPGRLVLEGHLAKTGERVPHVRLVVNGQPPAAVGVDVGKGASWQAGPVAGPEAGPAPTIPNARRRTQCRTAR